ncbi:MAG: protein kinase [Thermoanaerobaculales bacterium]
MMTDLQPGMMVGRYRLERKIARGGMGAVWAARDERLDREVVLKLLPRILVTDQSAERRFEREARAMARLQHPNVVSVFDVGADDPGTGDELPYMVMELIKGRALTEVVEQGPMPPRQAARIVEQIALALTAAHEAGVIHRDLKPSNVMVADGGQVKVLDFGLARLAQRDGQVSEDTLTTPGMVLGSCPYMAPEQALGKEVTPASDIFSCGAVLYEALSGLRAFDGATPMQVLQAVVRSDYRPLEEVAPETPPELTAVVERCLQRDQSRRYPNSASLAHDLAVFQGTDEDSLAEAPTLRLSTGKLQAVTARRRRIAIRAGAAAGVALTIGLLAGALAGRFRTEPLRPDPGRWAVRKLLESVGKLQGVGWSPDGKELVVAQIDVGRSEVLAVDASSGAVRTLVASGPGETLGKSVFSPDGKALLVHVIADGRPELRVIPAVGGRATATIEGADGGSWNDAETVLFSKEDGQGRRELWSYSLSRGEAMLVRTAENGRSWCSVMPRPGGGFALLAGPANIPNSLWVASGVGEPARNWLTGGKKLLGVGWAPSGRSLVASVEGRLVRVTAKGAAPLVPRLERLLSPALAPEGSRLAVIKRMETNDIISVDADGDGWSCLLCQVPNSGWGSIDVDGVIAYRRYVAGNATIFLRERSGVEVALTEAAEDASCPSFSPDGGRVAYLARSPDGALELRVVSRTGGQPVTLASGVEASEYPSWSPDGRLLTFAAGSPITVRVVSAAGGQVRVLTPNGGDYPQWSPDGRWIAYSVWTEDSDPDQGAWVVPSKGGDPRHIGSEPTRLVWSIDGERLWQLRRVGDEIELWEAAEGVWEWRRRSVLDLGRPPATHMEHLPLTVDPTTGLLVMNRRTAIGSLLVFEDLDPQRW